MSKYYIQYGIPYTNVWCVMKSGWLFDKCLGYFQTKEQAEDILEQLEESK